MKDKLIELLSENFVDFCHVVMVAGNCKISAVTLDADKFADRLIANGVTVGDVADANVGKWTHIKLCVPKGRGQTRMVWRCSNCHAHKKVRSPFCPECGFPMEMESK